MLSIYESESFQNDYNNYDTSKFSSSTSAVTIKGKAAERTKEDMDAIKTELEGAPSMKQFEYRPWDEDTRNFVNSVIKMYLNPGDAMDSITNQFEASTPAPKAEKAPSTPKAEKAPSTPKAEKEATPAGGDDLESFLNDLEL